MRTLCIQLQLDRLPAGTETDVLDAVRRAVPAANGVEGPRYGHYVNLLVDVAEPFAGWQAISALLDQHGIGSHLRRSSIVVCQGRHGWDDYLLLHHYDLTVILDGHPNRH